MAAYATISGAGMIADRDAGGYEMQLKRVVWWVSVAVFAFSAAWIGWYLYQAYFGAEALQGLSHEVAQQRAATGFEASEEPLPEGAAQGETQVIFTKTDQAPRERQDGEAEDKVLAAYAQLARENPDMVGWIYIQGTVVDYPVMHTPGDPERYLHQDFEGQYAFAGLPFLDGGCDPQAASANMIVYAHNMRSGQMFAPLREYLDPAFRQTHPMITFDTLARRGQYQVVAVLKLRAIGRQEPSMRCYRQIDTSQQEAVDGLNEYLERFATVREGQFQLGDDILTLSTCERTTSTDRLVVMARRVPDEPQAE